VADPKIFLEFKEVVGPGAKILEKVLVPLPLYQGLDALRVETSIRDAKEQHTNAWLMKGLILRRIAFTGIH
jgi:hypothetical protein